MLINSYILKCWAIGVKKQNVDEAHALSLKAYEAAKNGLGEEKLKQLKGKCEDRYDVKPYMRALVGKIITGCG